METREIVGRNLKALREANDFTQEQIARYLGVGRSAYANYESGDREAPVEILEKASELMGCDMCVLFDEDENAVKDMLVCAFRADNLCEGDIKEIAEFKNIVLNYMKMKKLLSE